MPYSKITKTTISHMWDDDSSTEYTISVGDDDEFGRYVDLAVSEESIRIYKDTWKDLLRDTIGEMMDYD